MTRRSLLLAPLTLAAQPRRVQALNIRILTTMLTDGAGIGEWGFAAMVEAAGKRILFDTGGRPDTLLTNARELRIDLNGIEDVILSHNHGDHTVGLSSLTTQLAKARIHTGKGIFYSRPNARGEGNYLVANKARFQSLNFVEHDKPVELSPGIWLTGPVPRKYPERNFSNLGKVATPDGVTEDTVPEDSSLVFDTDRGLVVLSGCGHAGIANTLEYARKVVRDAPIYAAVGGWHLFPLDDVKLEWTAGKLREFGVEHFLGAHCTGIEAVYRIRELNRMSRAKCVVGAVGASFDLAKGISPGNIAR
jgi:7,8-dihydropterin-6-yl-methyl-4-(beta-D-ribofuranosyl)aminobenzene 5'-phosphate synthase